MAFTFAAYCYIAALILSLHLLLLAFYQVVVFSELRSEKNPIVLSEYIIHASLTLLFLCSGSWFTCLLNVPLVAHHVLRYKNRPVVPRNGLFKWTPITYPPRNLNYASNEGICKFVLYLFSIFYYLFDAFLAIANY